MFTPIDSAYEMSSSREPRSLGELLPEVLARYGIAGSAIPSIAATSSSVPVVVHAAHAKIARRHPGPSRNSQDSARRREALRLPTAEKRLSAAG